MNKYKEENNRNIAVVIENLIQFQSIKNGIDALKKNQINVDIYVPTSNDKNGFKDIFNDAFNKLQKMGYAPKREKNPDVNYKILLEPYPMDYYFNFKYVYRIKYKYGPLSVKPNPVYKPEWNLCYDGIFCFGNYEAELLNIYSQTHIIDNLKYINFKKIKSNKEKPVVLYLPTYGDVSSIDYIINSIDELKEKYTFITKLHHGTSFLKDEKNRVNILKKISDECYDQNTELVELLKNIDVVLSDNSGSIFEAIYAQVPVAIFSNDINSNKLGDFNTTQFELVNQGFIPFTNKPNDIKKILKEALSLEYINKQKELRKLLFSISDKPEERFITIIKKYLNDDVNNRNKQLHDFFKNDYFHKEKTCKLMKDEIEKNRIQIKELESILESKNITLKNLKNELNINNSELIIKKNEILVKNKELEKKDKIIYNYENGKLYNIAKKAYKVYFKFTRKDQISGEKK